MTGKGGWPIAVDGEAEKLIDNELWNGQCETVIMKNVSLGSAFFIVHTPLLYFTHKVFINCDILRIFFFSQKSQTLLPGFFWGGGDG